MVTIDNNKTGAMWIRAIFRFCCQTHDCTMIKVTENTYAAEGLEENRLSAEYVFGRMMDQLLIRIINARAKDQERNPKTVTLETIRGFTKELWGV